MTRASEAGDPYQLLLTDMYMPKMDGFMLVENIRRKPELSLAAIMMLTSAGRQGDVERCRELGIVSYLFKPIRKADLLSAVRAVVGLRIVPPPPLPTLQSESIQRQSLSILLAEDNRINQQVATRLLERMGHSVVIANHGLDALSLWSSRGFDLILMDIQMPEMDGLTATKRIREEEREIQTHIPIIAMTAHAMKGDRERCIEAGMDEYLTKPINPRRVEEAIERVMSGQNASGRGMGSVERQAGTGRKMAIGWDAQQTLEKLGGDKNLLQDVMKIFLEENPKHIAKLRSAIAQNDAETVEKAAHSLKGELGYIGGPEILQRSRDLEEMGRNRNLKQAPEVFAILEAELFVLVESVREMNDNVVGLADRSQTASLLGGANHDSN
jgi:CheY-like chemotaxis protein/HPt (histidine-containing phosphotransfer) domain-containing protein